MLAKNKSGWKLLEYIDIQEKDVEKYRNVTGAFANDNLSENYQWFENNEWNMENK